MVGLRTLSELGQDHPGRRQIVVDALCSYLRAGSAEDDRADLEVRHTAQNLLAEHLRPYRNQAGKPQNEFFWEGMKINLFGAVLREARFDYCEFSQADFERAQFIGSTGFPGATFLGHTRFVHATFDGWWANFEDACFRGITWFRWANFKVLFQGTRFAGNAEFSRARFRQDADFSGAQVGKTGWFTHIIFHGGATFCNSWFNCANFIYIDFEGPVDFRGAEFNYAPGYGGIATR